MTVSSVLKEDIFSSEFKSPRHVLTLHCSDIYLVYIKEEYMYTKSVAKTSFKNMFKINCVFSMPLN